MRLDEIVAEYGDKVELNWLSFMLRPEPEERSLEKFKTYTKSWERPGSMEPKTVFNEWSGESEPPSHSMPSAIAGKVAALFGPAAYQQFHHAALKAYFTDNRTISSREVLLDIAAEAGIDRVEFDARWESQEQVLMDAVVREHNEAIGAGINAVPSLVVGERYLVPGAVDVGIYREVIEQFRSEREQ